MKEREKGEVKRERERVKKRRRDRRRGIERRGFCQALLRSSRQTHHAEDLMPTAPVPTAAAAAAAVQQEKQKVGHEA